MKEYVLLNVELIINLSWWDFAAAIKNNDHKWSDVFRYMMHFLTSCLCHYIVYWAKDYDEVSDHRCIVADLFVLWL